MFVDYCWQKVTLLILTGFVSLFAFVFSIFKFVQNCIDFLFLQGSNSNSENSGIPENLGRTSFRNCPVASCVVLPRPCLMFQWTHHFMSLCLGHQALKDRRDLRQDENMEEDEEAPFGILQVGHFKLIGDT